MAKKIYYESEAREKVLSGAKQLYDAVKVTFGPKGQNVIIEIYKLPKNNQKILKIFEKEIEGLLTDWAKSNFKEDVIEVLNNILYLTNTMRKRLLPLEGLN